MSVEGRLFRIMEEGMGKVKMESTVELTPRVLAEVFCNLPDIEQAEFFAQCTKVAREMDLESARQREAGKPNGSLGMDCQWLFIGDACLRHGGVQGDAARALAWMASPLYAHTLRFIDNYDKRLPL